MPSLIDGTPSLWRTITLAATLKGIPSKIVIQAIKDNMEIEIKDKKIKLRPNGKDKITIRATIYDAEGKLVSKLPKRKIKFQVEAQPPDVDINGVVSSSERNNKAQARKKIEDIYKKEKAAAATAKKVANSAIPRGIINRTEKAIRNGQADVSYTSPNLGGNQTGMAVDKITVTLPAKTGSNSNEIKQTLDVNLSYNLEEVDAGTGYEISSSSTGKHATNKTKNKIKEAGKLWNAILDRDEKFFPYINDALININDAKEVLSKLDHQKCLESVGKALGKLRDPVWSDYDMKIEDEPVDNSLDLQIVRNVKDRDTWKAHSEAIASLVHASNLLQSERSLHAHEPAADLANASQEIKWAYENLSVRNRPQNFRITALNLRHGGIYPPHQTHRDGKDADIGLMSGEAKGTVPETDRTTLNAKRKYFRDEKTYDRPLTLLLIKIFVNVGVSAILIYDANIRGPKISNHVPAHHNHLHIDFD